MLDAAELHVSTNDNQRRGCRGFPLFHQAIEGGKKTSDPDRLDFAPWLFNRATVWMRCSLHMHTEHDPVLLFHVIPGRPRQGECTARALSGDPGEGTRP